MNRMYGIFKRQSADNHYDSLAKSLNSAHTTKETQQTLKPLTGECSHGGYLVIHKGICYASFIHNYQEHNDDPFSPSLVLELAIFSLERALSDDFDIKNDVKLVCFDKSDEITGHINKTCAFIGNSLALVGDDLHITLSCQVDGNRYPLFHVVYDTNTESFSKATETKILYKDNLLPLDDNTIDMIYSEHGVTSGAPGMIQTTSKWSEYKGYYYSAFLLDGSKSNSGIIIRTKDFDTMEFVSVLPENENCAAEIGTCIYENKLYTAARQSWTTPYLLFSRYDLDSGEWKEPYCIEDANSRPWMFIYKNELYLYNTIDEGWRRYANISKVRVDKKAHNPKNCPINTVATIYGCGAYHCFYIYEERIFFISTYKAVVNFGELKLKEYSPEKVNERLVELLGEKL